MRRHIEDLEALSYRSKLGISLKRNLHYFDKDLLIGELLDMTDWLLEQDILTNTALDNRVKSQASILSKYERYYPDHQTEKVFNDVLGFRAFCDDYSELLQEKERLFRVVDLSKGKANDDGYGGVHVYYQLSGYHYPIETR